MDLLAAGAVPVRLWTSLRFAGRPGVPGEAGRCHSFSSSTSCGSEGVFSAFCAFFRMSPLVLQYFQLCAVSASDF